MLFPPRRAGLLPLISFAGTQNIAAQTKAKFFPEDELPMSASEVAKTAGLQPLFEWLRKEAAHSSSPLKEVLVRQQLLQGVTSESLQVDAAAGQIDAEIADINELESYLAGRRAREINYLNLASLAVGGSLGTASSSLGLVGEGKASNVTGILGGSIVTALSVVGLQRKGVHSQALQVPSNMLAHLFDRPSVANNFYPPLIEAYMHSVGRTEKEGLTRQQRLIRTWISVGRILEPTSAKGQEKIRRLTSMPPEGLKLSIGDLNDRQAMLDDFRAKLLYLKRDLAILLANVPASQALTELDLSHP